MTGDNVVIEENNIDGGWQEQHVNPPPPFRPGIFSHFPFRFRTSSSFAHFQLLSPELFAVLTWAVPHRDLSARGL